MKSKSTCNLCRRLSGTVAACTLWLWCIARAAAAPAEPPPLDLKQETALSVKVSFEVKRQPLSELLANLSQQSGIKLSGGEGSPVATARVTARVKEMQLSGVMSAFERLYGVSWTKGGDKAYTMNPSRESELDARLRQLGDMGWFRYWNWTGWYIAPKNLGIQPPPDWGAIIRQLVDYEAMRRGGVPFSSLPEEAQRQLREYLQALRAERLVRDYHSASQASLLEHGWLRVEQYPNDGPLYVLIDTLSNGMLLYFPLIPRAEETEKPWPPEPDKAKPQDGQ